MKKRILSTLLALCMVLALLPISAQATDTTSPVFGICGDNVTWALDRTGTILTIRGTGGIYDYSKINDPTRQVPWRDFRISKVEIQSGVTSIGSEAFRQCWATTATIPESVTSIGERAFTLSSLHSIVIPGSIANISSGAFGYCTNLTDITIGNGVVTIGDGAFMGLPYLQSITIPGSVTSIGESAFELCTSLRSVTIPSSVTEIGNCAFLTCNVTDVYYGGSEAQWNNIEGIGNSGLDKAVIHFLDTTSRPGDNNNVTPAGYETKTGVFSHYSNVISNNGGVGSVITVDDLDYPMNPDAFGANDIMSLHDKRVFFLLKDGVVIHIDAAGKLQSGLNISLSPSMTAFSYKDGKFNNNTSDVSITVTNAPNRSKYVFPAGYDTSVIYSDSSIAGNITIESITWESGEGINFKGINSNNIVLAPLGKGSVTNRISIEPKYVSKSAEETIQNTLTVKGRRDDGTVVTERRSFSITIRNQDINHSAETTPTSGELSEWDEGFFKELYKARDMDVHVDNSYVLSPYFTDSTIKDIGKIVVYWQSLLESELFEKLKNQGGDKAPTCLEIQCTIEKGSNKNRQAVLLFRYTSHSKWFFGSFSDIQVALIDKKSGLTIMSEPYSVSVEGSSKKFADGIKKYLAKEYGEDLAEFGAKYGEKAIKNVIKDIAKASKRQYLETMLDIFNNIEIITKNANKFRKYEEKASSFVKKPYETAIKDASDFDKVVSKRIDIHCPVDVYVYNSNGTLCGSIENNAITTDTSDVFMDVIDDQKTVCLNGNYEIKLVATDRGTMDYFITEYNGGVSCRSIEFNSVPLAKGMEYSETITNELGVSANQYALEANNGKIIYADNDTTQFYDGTDPATGAPNSSTSKFYSITALNSINGKIVVTPNSANEGSTVSIAVTPNTGYEMATISVLDVEGNEIKLIDAGKGKYRFSMPANDVTVQVAYRELDGEIPTISIAALHFKDVARDSWYYNAVNYVATNYIMRGDGSTTAFNPSGTTTRAMIVTILHRLEGEPIAQVATFTDVSKGQWYTDAISWAAANDIVGGYGNGDFGPTDPITREQMMTILYRYAKIKGYDVTANANISGYTDAAEISSYAESAMRWGNAENLISGMGDGTIAPKGSATRAQVATILMRFCENIVE